MIIARRWRTPKIMVATFIAEFPFTVAALALFAIAQPNTYRTVLWNDGNMNGFNSASTEILYSYANHDPIKTPIEWSQFITDYNVVISVLSMFVMLVKPVLFVMRVLIPVISVFVHLALVILYAYSVYGQSAPDMTDPKHPQKGAPWYITKSCKVVYDKKNYGFCQQAKASFAVTICLLAIFAISVLLSIYSCFPTKEEKLDRADDIEETEIPEYSPESIRNEHQWEKLHPHDEWQQLPITPRTVGFQNPMTPRTVAFQALDGNHVSPGSRALPFRERYGGVDGR